MVAPKMPNVVPVMIVPDIAVVLTVVGFAMKVVAAVVPVDRAITWASVITENPSPEMLAENVAVVLVTDPLAHFGVDGS